MGAFDGQVAIVTGSSSGIGAATAQQLSAEGASVVVNSASSVEAGEKLAGELESASYLQADIADESQCLGLVEATLERWGRLDILVNNAADRQQVPFVEMTYAQWRHITSIILDGAFLCSRAALKRMTATGWGRLINLGGIGNHMGFTGRQHVNTGKAGLEGLTRGLAMEFADQGITVNCVSPGKIGGPRPKSAGEIPPGLRQNVPPVGHEGVPDDIARTIRFLCQPDADFITGQTIHVNGGGFLT